MAMPFVALPAMALPAPAAAPPIVTAGALIEMPIPLPNAPDPATPRPTSFP